MADRRAEIEDRKIKIVKKKVDNKNNNKRIFIVVILTVLVIAAMAFFVFLSYNKKAKQEVASIGKDAGFKLIAEPADLDMNVFQPQQINLYLSKDGGKEDITNGAEWLSNNKEIVTVTNQGNKGYAFSLKEEGTTSIMASYQDLKVDIPVSVKKPEMEVACAPFIIKDGEMIKGTKDDMLIVKVGEEVSFLNLYSKTKIGSPSYIYKWTGDENFESEEPIPVKIYQTPGIKKINFFTQDLAGTTAEAECFVNVVE